MEYAGECLSERMVIYGCEMEIERELLEFGGFIYEPVHDTFVYLAEVFDLVVLLKPFCFVYEYLKIYVWVDLTCCDDELYKL